MLIHLVSTGLYVVVFLVLSAIVSGVVAGWDSNPRHRNDWCLKPGSLQRYASIKIRRGKFHRSMNFIAKKQILMFHNRSSCMQAVGNNLVISLSLPTFHSDCFYCEIQLRSSQNTMCVLQSSQWQGRLTLHRINLLCATEPSG